MASLRFVSSGRASATAPGQADDNGLRVGEKVGVASCGGAIGVVEFVGSVHFAPGLWVGVDLETAEGKNDGSVNKDGKAVPFFKARRANSGLFVRPAALQRLAAQTDTAASPEKSSASSSAITAAVSAVDSPDSQRAQALSTAAFYGQAAEVQALILGGLGDANDSPSSSIARNTCVHGSPPLSLDWKEEAILAAASIPKSAGRWDSPLVWSLH